MRLALPLLLAFACAAQAHSPNDPVHQAHCMGDLKLESGEAIKDFCISYVTKYFIFLDVVTQQGRLIQ
jgi:homoserine O-acetyltransferase